MGAVYGFIEPRQTDESGYDSSTRHFVLILLKAQQFSYLKTVHSAHFLPNTQPDSYPTGKPAGRLLAERRKEAVQVAPNRRARGLSERELAYHRLH
jgi:hypothetical protein